jgi:hypothetical protein
VEPDEHIAALDADGTLLAAAAERAGLDAPVPGCPQWQVRELLRHTGYVHRWAAGYVAHGYEEEVGRHSESELLRAGPDDADCVVAGTACELYLLLWNRLPGGGAVTVSGDPGLLRSWQDQVKVRWA